MIRADEENKEDAVKVHDPALAKESVSIGDFYFKKGNYPAALGRYEEAIEYNRQWPTGYEKLAKAHEKMGNFEGAVEACRKFLEVNPASEKRKSFEKLIAKYEAKVGQPK